MSDETNESQRQPYDRALKSLMEDHAAEMLPEILPESQLLDEQNVEITRTNLRADLVYLILYRDQRHILNLELQTDIDSDMAYRMLLYHVELYGKYRLPVISMVMYPFETTIPEPVFHEESGQETLLLFRHRILRLWTLEAEHYLRRRVVSMYTLLPAMKGANASMLLQAIEEMERQYKGSHLAHHLVRFRTILRRSKSLTRQDKQIVEDRLYPYDSLLDEDPDIQERIARGVKKGVEQGIEKGIEQGIEKGIEKGKVEGQQKAVIEFIEVRFPALVQTAQEQVTRLNKSDELSRLMKQVVLAPDEATARWVLSTFTA